MSGKARPSLRQKTLANVMRSGLSNTDKKCIVSVFKRFDKIVYCKDCIRYYQDTHYCIEHNAGYCGFDNVIKSKMHYCADGVRKDGADNE